MLERKGLIETAPLSSKSASSDRPLADSENLAD